jgi:hypothetical protein
VISPFHSLCLFPVALVFVQVKSVQAVDGSVHFVLEPSAKQVPSVHGKESWCTGFFGKLLYLTAKYVVLTGESWNTRIPETTAVIIEALGSAPAAGRTLLTHIFFLKSAAYQSLGYVLDPRNLEMIYASQLLDPAVPLYIIKAIALGMPPDLMYKGTMQVTMPLDHRGAALLPERPEGFGPEVCNVCLCKKKAMTNRGHDAMICSQCALDFTRA